MENSRNDIVKGGIVKFHSPMPDEDPDQLYLVKDVHFDVDKPRADVIPVNTDLNLPPIITVLVEELKAVKE